VLTLKLKTDSLLNLPKEISIPKYDRSSLKQAIVHIGVGGFHRAHQAVYTEQLLNKSENSEWGICGVGLRPEDRLMRDALSSQDNLYSVFELSEEPREGEVQIVGSICNYLFAKEDPQAVIEKMASPEVKIVSLTITEGGYCIDDSTGKFLKDLPEIIYDLEHPTTPKSVFGFLAQSLFLRRYRGIAPFTVMSCDNLPHNGDVARHALLSFTRLMDPDLHDWIDANVSFPNSMVDRITPMTSDQHKEHLKSKYSIEDLWPVVCEPYKQWILEDKFCNGRPEWDRVGVQFTDDVNPYEQMKIRLLNGSHMMVAYLGILLGYKYMHEAIQDELLAGFVRSFMNEDVSPLLCEVPGINLDEYKNTLIERFSNSVIQDQLHRIGSDGSSKFPKFVLPTLLELIEQGKSMERIALFLASWIHFLRGKDEMGNSYPVSDPRVDLLQKTVFSRDQAVESFLDIVEVFGPTVPKSNQFIKLINLQMLRIETLGISGALRQTVNK